MLRPLARSMLRPVPLGVDVGVGPTAVGVGVADPVPIWNDCAAEPLQARCWSRTAAAASTHLALFLFTTLYCALFVICADALAATRLTPTRTTAARSDRRPRCTMTLPPRNPRRLAAPGD